MALASSDTLGVGFTMKCSFNLYTTCVQRDVDYKRNENTSFKQYCTSNLKATSFFAL
jgi:hypothetical protein